MRESLAKAKPASPSTQHEIAHRRLKKARRDLERLHEEASKGQEALAAANKSVADSHAALEAKELQIVELEALFAETAKAALPAESTDVIAFDFALAAADFEGKPDL